MDVEVRLYSQSLLLVAFVAVMLSACAAPRVMPRDMPNPGDDRFRAPAMEEPAAAAPSPRSRTPLGTPLGTPVGKAPSSLTRARAFPVDAENRAVLAEVEYLIGQRRSTVHRWFERSDHWEPFVSRVLAQHGLPGELIYVAMIESGFATNAVSHASATGMWQFMAATGRLSGLRVDDAVDERLDPVRSTQAAARHLKELFDRFGDWRLAAAAYNAGSGGVQRAMSRASSDDFWVVAERGPLPAETRRYVPRLMAVALIGEDRQSHGLPAPAARDPFDYDSVRVANAVPLSELARVSGLALATLQQWNPHLVHGITPDAYWLWVPRGKGSDVARAYRDAGLERQAYLLHTVRAGEARDLLVGAAGGPDQFSRLNPSANSLSAGSRVILPAAASSLLEEAAVARARAAAEAASAARSRPGQHVVSSGETLSGLARKYGVTVAALREANQLKGDQINIGQRLVIPGHGAEYVVRDGDTLGGIAQRHGTTVAAIKQLNGFADDTIRVGQKLRLPR
jgi:membrane-bound lytic murein transglycosylase D